LALLQPECSAIVILFDGEDDCPMNRTCRQCSRLGASRRRQCALRGCCCLSGI
jgi:hypothetical protein